MPYLTSDERVAKAERWLEPRMRRIAAVFAHDYARRKKAGARLVVPSRIVRLYFPYHAGRPIVSDSIRKLMALHGIDAIFPGAVDGPRHSQIFDFYPNERKENRER